MRITKHLHAFRRSDEGSVLVFWGVGLVIFFGFLALTFDFGRMASTQTDLQAFADNVALAAAGELDGRDDAIDRARAAAAELITDSQTFGNGDTQLSGPSDYTLTFHSELPDDDPALLSASIAIGPQTAHYVHVSVHNKTVDFGFGRAFAALSGLGDTSGDVGAEAVAGFDLILCDVQPVAMCSPSSDFRAAANIGSVLELDIAADMSGLLGGGLGLVDTAHGLLGDTSVCAGLAGRLLSACLVAARDPGVACFGDGGINIGVDLSVLDIEAALDVRFGEYTGPVGALAGDPNFPPAPNILAGLTDSEGNCVAQTGGTFDDLGLPLDDCFDGSVGACVGLGDGNWDSGREDYVDTYYDGVDPFPEVESRYDFYVAELSANNALLEGLLNTVGGTVGGLGGALGLGGVTDPLAGLLCNPPGASDDPARRLMTIASLDCLTGAGPSGGLHVQEYFDVFVLGPTEDGKVAVEIVACLGADCAPSPTGAEVRDFVRLYK